MTVHTYFARTYIDDAVRSGALKGFRLELDDALSSLQELVESQTQHNEPESPVEPKASFLTACLTRERPLPDVQLAMACLRISKGQCLAMLG